MFFAREKKKNPRSNYTPSVLSTISKPATNYSQVAAAHVAHCLYSKYKRKNLADENKPGAGRSDEADAEWELSTPIPGHKLRNNIVKYSCEPPRGPKPPCSEALSKHSGPPPI